MSREAKASPVGRRRRWTPVGVAGVTAVLLAVTSACAVPSTDLGTLGGARSRGAGVAAYGPVVVGAAQLPDGSEHAFSYHRADGRMVDLGAPGGVASEATDVSEQGFVVGTVTAASGARTGYVWTASGSPVFPLEKHPSHSAAVPLAMSLNNMIAGYGIVAATGVEEGLVWYPDLIIRSVRPVAGWEAGTRVEDVDGGAPFRAVGSMRSGGGDSIGFVWHESESVGRRLATPAGFSSVVANALNRDGLIVGHGVTAAGVVEPLRWRADTAEPAGPVPTLGLGGGLRDVNATGVAVGWARGADGVDHAYCVRLGDAEPVAVDLGPGVAVAIADDGTIAGTRDGHAVIWEPRRCR